MGEPPSNLDPHFRGTTETELLRFHPETGAWIIYVTHVRREAMALADRMAAMKDGSFLQVGTAQEVNEPSGTADVAALIGHGAVVPVVCRGRNSESAGVVFPVDAVPGQPDGPAPALMRPADVEVLSEHEDSALVGQGACGADISRRAMNDCSAQYAFQAEMGASETVMGRFPRLRPRDPWGPKPEHRRTE